MKRRLISISVGLVILFLAYTFSNVILHGDKMSFESNTEIIRSVKAQEVINQSNDIYITVNGSLESKERIDLLSEVQGIFIKSKKYFKAGQDYKKNEVIIEIESQEFLATVKQYRSELQNLIASVLPDIKIDFNDNYKNWETYFKKFNVENNTSKMPIPLSDQEKFYIVGKGLNSLFYKVKNLEERLNKYKIKSPFNGTLTESYISEGSLISPNQKLGVLINPSLYELEVAVPSKFGDKLNIGKNVKFLSSNNESYTGKIRRINKSIDDYSQSIRLYIEFNSPKLKEGMFAEVDIPLGRVENSFSISRSLLINDSFVYYVKNNMTIGIIEVDLIFNNDEYVIVKGLENGTKIISTFIPGIYEGMKVNIINL